jgi:type I restriction enzyme S subunit
MREDDALARLQAHGIHKVPESWALSKVKYLANYINGYPFKPDDWGDRGKPIIRIQNLTDSTAEPNRYDLELADSYSVKNGDFLISWSASLGLHVWEGEPAWLNQHIFKVELDEEKCTKPFFKWLATWFMDELSRDAHGSTMQHLTKDAFGSFPVLLPNKPKQLAVASFLDSAVSALDTLAQEKISLLELLAEKRRALITQAVTKGLDSAVAMKDSGIAWLGEIPVHWEIWKIGHFAAVGNGSTPFRDNPLYWHEGSIPWLNSASTNEEVISSATQYVTTLALKECHLPLVKPNSVLVAITGQGKTRGQASVLLFEATINQHVAYITAD